MNCDDRSVNLRNYNDMDPINFFSFKDGMLLHQATKRTKDCTPVGMKTDENERENPSTVFISVFYYGKREQEQNNREQERKRDIPVTEMGRNQKIYRKALLFNLHSPYMNITLHTSLCKLFFQKNMIKTICFLCVRVKCTD